MKDQASRERRTKKYVRFRKARQRREEVPEESDNEAVISML